MSNVSSRVKNSNLPVGVCDQSGFIYNLKDLIKQREWVGDSLQWNGLMVGKDQADVPNDQNRPFKAKIEGVLPPNSRPLQGPWELQEIANNGTITDIPIQPYGPELTQAQVFQQLENLVNG